MKYFLLLFVSLVLIQCKDDELLPPVCDFITVEQTEDRLKITIDSDDPSITICRDYQENPTQCWTILSNYYECISMAYTPGEVFYVHSSEGICIFKAD